MRILTFIGPLHREFGGPPMAAVGIASSLSKLGNQVKMVVCGQSIADINLNAVFFDQLNAASVDILVISRRKESKYGTFLRFREISSIWRDIAKSDFVILHQVFEFQYFAIFPILLLTNTPYGIMPHGTLTEYQRRKHRFRKIPFFPVTYVFLKLAKAIFVATEQEKLQLPSYLNNLGDVVGLGIDLQPEQPVQEKNSSSTFNLLYMGRITNKKRLDIALQAFSYASDESKILMRFIVCGSGEQNEMMRVQKVVKDLRIEGQVDFRGWVELEEKRIAYSESDCFILTSEDENFAIAAAEALARGIPCIVSSNVALSSLVSKYGAGEVFTELRPQIIGEAIINVALSDPIQKRRVSLLAASEISWESIGQNWASKINHLVTK